MRIQSARFVVYASDVSASYRFYTDVLGLEVVDRVIGGTVLAAGAIEIELLQERRDEEVGLDRRTGLLIFVDDADVAYSGLVAQDAVLLTEEAPGADRARSF